MTVRTRRFHLRFLHCTAAGTADDAAEADADAAFASAGEATKQSAANDKASAIILFICLPPRKKFEAEQSLPRASGASAGEFGLYNLRRPYLFGGYNYFYG